MPLVILAALPRCSLLLFPQNSLRDFCGSPGSLMRFLWEPYYSLSHPAAASRERNDSSPKRSLK